MRKVSVLFLAVLVMVFYTAICSAFPAPGIYESVERARASDTGKPVNFPLWKLCVNQSGDSYSGILVWNSKGAWNGSWSAPLSVTADSNGRYFIDVSDSSYMSGTMQLQETSDGSLLMSVQFNKSPRVHEAVMTKVE